MLLLVFELCVAIMLQLGLFSTVLQILVQSDVSDIASRGNPPTLSDEFGDIVAGVLPVEAALLDTGKKRFIEVIDSCGVHFDGDCLVVRSAPTTTALVVTRLRTGVVVQVDSEVNIDGRTWYKIAFDEWLRYPERLQGDWYIAGDFVEVFYDEGVTDLEDREASTTKRIVVDRSSQTLVAYEDERVFMEADISAGLELTPTPRGNFTIFRKTPTRYMQGPLPYLVDKQIYDLPGVPWTLYFTEGGAAIHGTYWHDNFGTAQSHGCVNLSPQEAKNLYGWADLGTKVLVRD